jgi:hypothetical protein
MSEVIHKPQTVQECWTIAFELAEHYQEEMNKYESKELASFNLLKAKRDVASEIAYRIKFGGRTNLE